MYPFSQAANPALRTHIDAQAAYLNGISRSMFRSFQHMCDLNIQLAQAMLEETTLASRQLLAAHAQGEAMSAAASRAQPATDKLRTYQQHMSRLAADTQVDLAHVTEQHAQNTARTARAVADEVARTATEETERGLHAQQDTVRRPAEGPARSADAGQSQMRAEARGAQTMQSANEGAGQGGSQGGGSAQTGTVRAEA